MSIRTHSDITAILEKVLLGEPLESHEKAALTYTTLVLRDYKVGTNDELTKALVRSEAVE
jgi:hypothetical protein